VALFGFMGVGKSVVAQRLSERTGLAHVDIDETIECKTGKTIPEIFDEGGESTFREIERAVTREIAAREGQVIACGGGTVLDEENLTCLRLNSAMILLTASPETILERVNAEGDVRPLLRVEDKLERIRSLLEARNAKYLPAADMVVDTSGRTTEQVADEILEYLREVGVQ
jgi:shikimate kinase